MMGDCVSGVECIDDGGSVVFFVSDLEFSEYQSC